MNWYNLKLNTSMNELLHWVVDVSFSDDLFWCGMSRKCASTPCIFGPVKAADFGTKCLLWRHLATSVTMPSGPFLAFLYTVAQSSKLPSFSFVANSGQIWPAVQNGEKSNLPGHCTVFELRWHATEVWPDWSSWIFHTIFCCRCPFCNLGNTLRHHQIFLVVKFWFFDFVISSYLTSKLSTDVLYLLSV